MTEIGHLSPSQPYEFGGRAPAPAIGKSLPARALHPWKKPVVGWVSGATRAFVFAGRFVGIYPTPVSIFAGAGSLHGSGIYVLYNYVKVRLHRKIEANFLILSQKFSKLAFLMFIHQIIWCYITKYHTNFNIHSSLLILIGSHISKIGVIWRPVNRPDKASFSWVPVG